MGSSNIDSCDIVARRLGDPDITGSNIRRMDYSECVVICGNEGGIYKKYDIKRHPRYSMIADRPSATYYDLKGKHHLQRKERTGRRYNGKGDVVLKEGLFDSREEAYLYSILCRISNIAVYPHQQLRDIFQSGDAKYSMKLSYMHCDFVIRDDQQQAMFAIEVDGMQHCSNRDQIANDKLKDHFFEMNHLPLLRFDASDIRNSIEAVLHKIMVTASERDQRLHTLDGEVDSFHNWSQSQMGDEK